MNYLNDEKCTISIITATYRNFEHIYATIDSVLMQDYPYLEYIITDDGTMDFPEEQLQQYIEDHKKENLSYRIIRHTKNIGTVKNLNYAYKISSGSLIFNLSCGDSFLNSEIVNRIAKRMKESDCDVLVTSRLLYEGDFKPLGLLPHYEERSLIKNYTTGIEQYKAFITSRFYDMASGSAMYLTKRILEKMNYYDEAYRLWEDGPFLAKYLLIGKIECAFDIVSIWYETGGVSDDKKKGNSRILTPIEKDTILFIRKEKMSHLEMFSAKERRLIRYRNRMFLTRSRWKRYFLHLLYIPEYMYYRRFFAEREKRIERDQEEIQLIIKSEV